MRRRATELRKLDGEQNTSEAQRLEVFAGLVDVQRVELQLRWNRGPPQNLALAYFFQQAFKLAQQGLRPISLVEARNARKHYLKMAHQICADATEQEEYGESPACGPPHLRMKNWQTRLHPPPAAPFRRAQTSG